MNRKLFISHSSNDVAFVEPLVELLEGIGIQPGELVCSSSPGYGIPLGVDIFDWLRQQFVEYDLHVIFILSKNYYDSVPCLNEMGATWLVKQKYDIILLPGFEFSDMKGSINANQIGIKIGGDELEVKQRLNELKDSILFEFGYSALPAIRWEKKRDEFLQRISYISKQEKRVPKFTEDQMIVMLNIYEQRHMTVNKKEFYSWLKDHEVSDSFDFEQAFSTLDRLNIGQNYEDTFSVTNDYFVKITNLGDESVSLMRTIRDKYIRQSRELDANPVVSHSHIK